MGDQELALGVDTMMKVSKGEAAPEEAAPANPSKEGLNLLRIVGRGTRILRHAVCFIEAYTSYVYVFS